MRYKLRFYKKNGIDKGNLDHEEYFNHISELIYRYDEVFEYGAYSLNPTAWRMDTESGEYVRIPDGLINIPYAE